MFVKSVCLRKHQTSVEELTNIYQQFVDYSFF